jgi:predicted dehydrogenase
MADTVRTGLVGAGPWASVMHAPLLAGGPGTSLEAVWARREDAATELAQKYGAAVAGSFEELLERCDAIAFAVPPDVQAALAPRAAKAGRHLLLEKPLAFSLADAERLADAVDEAGVRTLLFLTNRFTAEGREFVRRAAEAQPQAAQARSLGGGSLPGSLFATPWRVARGALLDLGPHVLDLLVTALGPVAEISATGDPTRVVALTTRHESGLLGQALLSITTADGEGALVCHLHTASGPVVFDSRTVTDQAQVMSTIAREFSTSVRTGVPHELDVHRGLMLQRLLGHAEATLVS